MFLCIKDVFQCTHLSIFLIICLFPRSLYIYLFCVLVVFFPLPLSSIMIILCLIAMLLCLRQSSRSNFILAQLWEPGTCRTAEVHWRQFFWFVGRWVVAVADTMSHVPATTKEVSSAQLTWSSQNENLQKAALQGLGGLCLDSSHQSIVALASLCLATIRENLVPPDQKALLTYKHSKHFVLQELHVLRENPGRKILLV